MSKMRELDKKFTNCYAIVMKFLLFIYIFIGGRGIGKTYSMLKETYLNGVKLMYVRRTQEELDIVCSELNNPYKKINSDLGVDIRMVRQGKAINIIEYSNGEPKESLGVACALSTFGKFRGSDFSDIDIIVFDEFILTGGVNTLKREDELLFNLIETVNRNRELLGEPAIKVVLLSNANTLDNDLIRALDLAQVAYDMQDLENKVYIDEERGIYFELLSNDAVRDEKMKTKLYKLTRGTSFYEMALNNEFTNDYFGDTKQVDFRELVPIVAYENIYFYRHKTRDLLYVSKRKSDCPKYTKPQYQKFMRTYGFRINMLVCSGLAIYQNYNVKLDAKHILNNKFI